MVCPLNFYIKRISKLSDFRVEGFETRLIFLYVCRHYCCYCGGNANIKLFAV